MRTVALHIVNTELGHFYAGIFHVLLSPDHLLPLIALGIIMGFQEKTAARHMLLTTVIAGLAGGLYGRQLDNQAWLAYFNFSSFVVLGALAAYGKTIKPPIALSLSAIFAGTQSMLHMADLPAGVNWEIFLSGVLLGLGTVATVISAIAMSLPSRWMRLALRIYGSWVAALGLLMMALIGN